MVAPIRDSENIFFRKSAITRTTKRMSFAKIDNIDVDDIYGGNLDNYDSVRGLTIFPANLLPSLNIMSVTEGLVNYVGKMERNNDINEEIVELVNRSQLSYAMNDKETLSSKIAAIPINMIPPHVINVEPICNFYENNNMFNI